MFSVNHNQIGPTAFHITNGVEFYEVQRRTPNSPQYVQVDLYNYVLDEMRYNQAASVCQNANDPNNPELIVFQIGTTRFVRTQFHEGGPSYHVGLATYQSLVNAWNLNPPGIQDV